MLYKVKAGDIIYEANGGSGITGHIVIVEGLCYSSKYGQYFIRVVESIGYISGSGYADGVCRGVLDDDRIDDRAGTVLRVTGATSSQKSDAISFCVSQIGKSYDLGAYHRTSSSSTGWYCSELVWAAYYNQGIDLESTRGAMVTPDEIKNSNGVTTVSLNTIGTPSISYVKANSATSATIAWGSVTNATRYYIYRSTSATGTYTLVATTTDTNYKNTGLTAGSTYYYRIAAFNSSGRGNMSVVKAIRMSFDKPYITTAYEKSDTSVYLAWTAVYGATGYNVYRSTSATGAYSKIATTTARTYSNANLTAGTSYYYKIEAFNADEVTGKSLYSLLSPGIVNKPTFYYGKADSSTAITVKWTSVPYDVTYYVYRSTSANGTYSRIATTTKTYYTDSGRTSGTKYYYKIRAYNSGSYSAYSAYKAITTL